MRISPGSEKKKQSKIFKLVEPNRFYSNGKFLLTGEYLILNGAKGLAIPLRMGQSLQVSPLQSVPSVLRWKTFEKDSIWFFADFSLEDFSILHASDENTAKYLSRLLQSANYLNPEAIIPESGLLAISEMDFNFNWGLGSSSTLTSNIANWFGVDPMKTPLPDLRWLRL